MKMSVMSKKETDGFRKLLKLLSEDDLLALKDTVTNRLIPVENSGGKIVKLASIPDSLASSMANFGANELSRNVTKVTKIAHLTRLDFSPLSCACCLMFTEATEAIITYSQSAEELLKRKKVNREVLFKYLASEGVAVAPNSEKHQLVKKTLELWSSDSEVHQLLTRTYIRSLCNIYNYINCM